MNVKKHFPQATRKVKREAVLPFFHALLYVLRILIGGFSLFLQKWFFLKHKFPKIVA